MTTLTTSERRTSVRGLGGIALRDTIWMQCRSSARTKPAAQLSTLCPCLYLGIRDDKPGSLDVWSAVYPL